MKHFVQYHNTEKMGHDCGALESDTFEMVTDKSIRHLPGNTVWLVAGKGKNPRRYYLCKVFVVDEVGDDDGDYKYYASGNQGKRFRPLLPIDSFPGFAEFRESQTNFSLGVREIEPRFVQIFQQLAQTHAK